MAPAARGRRIFGVGAWRFQVPRRAQDAIFSFLMTVTDGTIYLIGPILICFALVIMSGLSYSFFVVVLPMMQRAWALSPFRHIVLGLHISYVIFVLVNVIYNYALCVTTSNKGAAYNRVVRELADVTGFPYPETPDEVAQCKRDYEDRMILRMERRRARRSAPPPSENSTAVSTQGSTQQQPRSESGSTVTQRRSISSGDNTQAAAPITRGWMLMGPHEWGFCPYSNQPKPPRSHYDHVTKMLVLNMDHYCPW